ncbi:MAG: hypothetical protein RIF41_37415, partial [Polyangiaceae bacterium]
GGTGGVAGGSTSAVGGAGGVGGEICASVSVSTSVEKAPADVVFVVDNSGSMGEEIAAIEQNINVNFAGIIEAAAIDYRVIMITDHGSANLEVCVEPPLSPSANCQGAPSSSNQFHHYDVNVASHDSLCILLDTLHGANPLFADEHGLYPDGWAPLLRPEAIKFIIEISDDGTSCSSLGVNLNDSNNSDKGKEAAVDFDTWLTGLAPDQFGTLADRRYKFYAIVGVAANSPPSQPYGSEEPYVTGECFSAVDVGATYQWLAKGTGGYRFPVCETLDYGPIFEQIANDVLVTTAIPCTIELPEEPAGETYDLDALEVAFTATMGGSFQLLTQVADVNGCTGATLEFYVEAGAMELCPAACAAVTDAGIDDGTVTVDVRCE